MEQKNSIISIDYEILANKLNLINDKINELNDYISQIKKNADTSDFWTGTAANQYSKNIKEDFVIRLQKISDKNYELLQYLDQTAIKYDDIEL